MDNMKRISRQFFLLFLYFVALIIVSRILDLILWHLQGLTPTQVVDPRVFLSVKQLKSLLDVRGVGYSGCVEKHELAELVENSGAVVRSEIAALDNTDPASKAKLIDSPSHFSGGAHFYEEVEDTKDSVWLVQVAPEGSEPPLDDYSWRLICAHLAPFAIRTGVFDCKLDRRLCVSKGWHDPMLLLALPRGTKAKDKVLMQIFHSTRPQAIVSWVRQQLSDRIEKLTDINSSIEWIKDKEEVKVLLITHLSNPPLFLAALSVKFAGRIRFAILNIKTTDEESINKIKKEYNNNGTLPYYIISTSEGNHIYSKSREEHYNFKSMLFFLRTVQPEANDALILSLIICQLISMINSARKRSIITMVLTFVMNNLFLLIFWLIIISIGHVSFISQPLSNLCVKFTRWFSLSSLGMCLRGDIQLLTDRHPYILIMSTIMFLYIIRKYLIENEQINRQQSIRIDFITRLIPTSQSTNTIIEPEELLVQRLAVPGLWLTPIIYSDYLRMLSRWRYRPTIDINKDKLSRSFIEELSKLDYSSDENSAPSYVLKSTECPICLESYSEGVWLCALPCGHTYHDACVMAWLLRDHHSCPSCRWPAYKPKIQ